MNIILTEVELTSYRMKNHGECRNDESMRPHHDLVDKVKAIAEQSLALYQDLMAKHYNSRIRHRDF